MLEPIFKPLVIALLAGLLLPGCQNFTKSGRQQIAYARYVKKYSGKRIKQQKKFKKIKMPSVPTPPNQVDMGVNDSPQSVNSGESQSSE